MTVHRPLTFDEAAEISGTGARIIAGGTAVQPTMNASAEPHTDLVSLADVADAWTLSEPAPGRIKIGAMVPVSHLERWGLSPRWFATPAVRRRATLVGNLVHRGGLQELQPLIMACGGALHWCGAEGISAVGEDVPGPAVATAVEFTAPDVLIHQRTAIRDTMARPRCAVTLAHVDGDITVVTSGTGMTPTAIPNVDCQTTTAEFVAAVVDSTRCDDTERLAVLARRTHDEYRRYRCNSRG